MSNLSPLTHGALGARQARIHRAARFRLAHQVNLLRWQCPQLAARDSRHELLEEYGTLQPFGTLRRGGASEHCWACGLRDYGDGCYVWLLGPVAVCNASCAAAVAKSICEDLVSGRHVYVGGRGS